MTKCQICSEDVFGDEDDYFVHVYVYHPAVNEQICKQSRGEPFKSIEQLRAEGLERPCSAVDASQGEK